MAEDRILRGEVEAPQSLYHRHGPGDPYVISAQLSIDCKKIPWLKVQYFLSSGQVQQQYSRFRHPGHQGTDCCAGHAHFRGAEAAVDQGIIDAAVNDQCDHGESKSDLYRPRAPQCSQKDLGDCKERISKAYDPHIADPFGNNGFIRREDRQDNAGEQAHGDEQDNAEPQSKLHRAGRNLFDGLQLFLSEILASEYHDAFTEGRKKLLVYKLDLVDRSDAGQGHFAVSANHDIVRKIYAECDHILQHQYDQHRKKLPVKAFFPYHFFIISTAPLLYAGFLQPGTPLRGRASAICSPPDARFPVIRHAPAIRRDSVPARRGGSLS